MSRSNWFFVLALGLPLAATAAGTRGLDVRDLANLDRLSSPVLSADGQRVVYAVRETDFEGNRGVTHLVYKDLRTRDAAPPARLTPDGFNVNSPSFSADGGSVYFLSAKSGSMQLWAQQPGAEPVQVSDYPLDVGSYKLSPDGRKVALTFDVFAYCADLACSKAALDTEAARKSSGKLYDKLFVRHWDTWSDGRRSQLFVASLKDGKTVGEPVKISAGIDGDIPSKPFGDTGEYAWSPDGRQLAFSVRIAGTSEAWSTNFDIYLAPADGGSAPVNLTAANLAWDTGPLFSADGNTLYYRAMERPGFEADRFGIVAMDLDDRDTRRIARRWDRSADTLALSADGRTLYTTAYDLGQHPLFAIDIESGEARPIAADGNVSEFALAGNTLVFARDSLRSPAQIFVAAGDGSAPRQLSNANAERLAELAMGAFEQFRFEGYDDDTVYGYVVKPWNYQAGQKYPVAFLIHGGPQGSFGNGWSYRWNPQTYAAQGFAVVFIDFHGSTGYGQDFTDSISRDWGGKPLEDLQEGWSAALDRYNFLDGNRACALGASYGGFMINWIAGNWNAPWKCLVVHDGVFDTRMMGYATEELWFSEWENGGTPFAEPKAYEEFNPIRFVDQWRVPMLVVQGQQDFRVPFDQGMAAFTAAQRRGIESRFLYFPDENHWVLKPQNSVQWHDTVNDWLRRWTAQK